MANPKHIEIVKGGRSSVEDWRRRNGRHAVLDLSHADLRGVSLRSPDLRHANLAYANLDSVVLKNANLTRANLSFTTFSNAILTGANMKTAVFKGTNFFATKFERSSFEEAVLLNVTFDYCRLYNACLSRSLIKGTSFRNAFLWGARFSRTKLIDCDCSGADCTCANLRHTTINRSIFVGAKMTDVMFNRSDIRNCDFTKADCNNANFGGAYIMKCHLIETALRQASLDGIRLYGTETEGWDIAGVRCSCFFTFINGQWVRLPRTGNLIPGEFEDRFRSRPTIEYVFTKGMNALAPAVLELALDEANTVRPTAGLRLLDITARGGIPRAVIEVADKVSKEDALALVSACYEQRIQQMTKEIESLNVDKQSLLQITSQRLLLPPLKSEPKYMNVNELAEHYEIHNREALRARLYRFRVRHKFGAEAFQEVTNRGVRQPQFLYSVAMVGPTIQALKAKEIPPKRPSRIK